MGRAAPAASSFPAANDRKLPEVLAEGAQEGPVISPAMMVLRPGENRYTFGVFTVEREQITDAEVALYVAHGPEGVAKGPFPARIESLETDPQYRAKTTADDPSSAKVAYVAELELPRTGEYRIGALVRQGDDKLAASGPVSGVVKRYADIPAVGDRVPKVSTPTVQSVGGDVSKVETRDPPDTMHETDLADVIGKRPAVIVFATPRLCQSRVCGPVVDATEQVKAGHGDRAAFIHMEIFKNNDPNGGVRRQVEDFGLPTEPWVFVIDRRGRVASAIEGPFSVQELDRAVAKVTGGAKS